MRAIQVMFDTMKRDFLPNYGGDLELPNFQRLEAECTRFDNFWAGSLPCMPARRELHSGRYNFLHRGWGPLEPFDVSVPEMLKNAGVHTHLVSDHFHYWMDGGANYHPRYTTWQNVRGQEGDSWQADLGAKVTTTTLAEYHGQAPAPLFRQDAINRLYIDAVEDTPQAKVVEGGLGFINRNHAADNWFLQIECFDPHEPFFTRGEWEQLYAEGYTGPALDWPQSAPVQEDAPIVKHIQDKYRALMQYCDASLGKVLDLMDKYNMWEDTLLIVNTDHGYMLGEKGWWGKNIMPYYNEVAHLPFFLHDPRCQNRPASTDLLCQTIDIPATLLDYFGLDAPPQMQGKPLSKAVETGEAIRTHALFGIHGGHVNITDGRYVYMRAPVTENNTPLYEYTLMPARSFGRTSPALLATAEMAPPFNFTQGCATLRMDATVDLHPDINMHRFGTMLFDLQHDPQQLKPIHNAEVEAELCQKMVQLMQATDAPAEQYLRMGLA